MSAISPKAPSLLDSTIPIVSLMILLGLSVYLYGDESSNGANQIALLLSACIAIVIGFKNGFRWPELNEAIAKGVASVFGSVLIIITVGALIGVLVISGTVPAMIYYGLQVINPQYFYLTACILCAVASISIGSSWSVAGTIGVGLMGISAGLELSPEVTAGAIISGAYFGDKMSPLSDTTNLAPAVAGTDLFTHIRHMTWTTIPSISLALLLYLAIGLGTEVNSDSINVEQRLSVIDNTFNINFALFLPLVAIFYMAVKKFPAFPALIVGSIIAAILGIVFQQEVILNFVDTATNQTKALSLISGVWQSLFSGYISDTGNLEIDLLFTRGGINSMSSTVFLILCAITFGSVLERLGILKHLVVKLISMAKSTGSLVLVTAITCTGINFVAGDQYIAIVLAGRMYKLEFQKRELAAKNLSRILEDTGTVTSVLIPWNTCGAFLAGTLGIATFSYAPYCFFNIFCPITTIVYGMYNFTIEPIDSEVQISDN